AIQVKTHDSELDQEPVARTALHHLRTVQQSIPHCPKVIDLRGHSLISIYGDRDLTSSALRAWVAQLTCWHAPTMVRLAVTSTRLEDQWGWVKWYAHTESEEIDGAGQARYLATNYAELMTAIAPLTKGRPSFDPTVAQPDTDTDTGVNLVVVVDDPSVPEDELTRLSHHAGVTVIAYRGTGGPHRDHNPGQRQLVLSIDCVDTAGAPHIRQWSRYRWADKAFCDDPDMMDIATARHTARLMAKWDAEGVGALSAEVEAAQNYQSLLGIDNPLKVDVPAMWADRPWEEQLRAPLGFKPDGSALIIDLKDEADGGNGPHGLMIGMTGSGKTTLLRALVFGLVARHSADVVQLFLGDFKDEAGFDAFADFPHTVGVVSNMEEKKSLVDRFGETLLGMLDARGRIFKTEGQRIQGKAFEKLSQYNAARQTPAGAHLPPMPTMFIIVDEFSLMIKEHKHMAEVFDILTRKGRSYGIFFLFASQTLDEGQIGKIPENTQYKIGLKVAGQSISRRIIGTEEAYHLPDGPNFKGTGFFVRAPGAEPIKFRGPLLPEKVEAPTKTIRTVTAAKPRVRSFLAGPVKADPGTVVTTTIEAESVIVGPPRSLELTVGPQLAAYDRQLRIEQGLPAERPQLWAPPLDDPIPLDAVLGKAQQAGPGRLPWWPLGLIDRPRQLRHDLLNYSLDQGNVSVIGAKREDLSLVMSTFVLSAASRYAPQQVGFYALAYGGDELGLVKDLPHVGQIGGRDRRELNTRILSDLAAVVDRRRRLFAKLDLTMNEYRRRRYADPHDRELNDGYPIDIFLIIDGWEAFMKDATSDMVLKNPQIKQVEALATDTRGLHVAVTSADRITCFSPDMLGALTCKFELKLANASMSSEVRPREEDNKKLDMLRPNDKIPVGEQYRGRGLASTGETIRFAVGRTDGKASTDDLDEQIRHTVAAITSRVHEHKLPSTPRPRLLPTLLTSSELAGMVNGTPLGVEQHALGLRGSDITPLIVDFAQTPLLGLFGDPRTGKTMTMRQILRGVLRTRTDLDKTMVMLVDLKKDMQDETAAMDRGTDLYITNVDDLALRLAQLDQQLQRRVPPSDTDWGQVGSWQFEGPTVWLFINNLDLVPKHVPGQGLPMFTPTMLGHLGQAANKGLRVIVNHPAAGIFNIDMDPGSLVNRISKTPSYRILLSGPTDEKVSARKFEQLD
ncbi:MAG: type VII secretion protein EccCa, partial [Actinobacteria bacterium]|nr:type VII secretion protein EccCa [Actinomycetota bacterium]